MEEPTKLGQEIVIVQPRCTEGMIVPLMVQRALRPKCVMKIPAQVKREKFNLNLLVPYISITQQIFLNESHLIIQWSVDGPPGVPIASAV